MGRHYKLVIMVAALSILLVAVCSSALAIKNAPGIANGVHSEKIDLSGLDQQTAQKLIADNFAQELADGVVVLAYNGTEKTIKANDIDLSCNSEKTAQAAAAIGASGNFFKDTFDKIICSYQGKNVPLEITYDKDKLNNILKTLAASVHAEPVNAYAYTADGSTVKIVKEKTGRSIDTEQLAGLIADKIETENYPQTVTVPINTVEPDITADKLSQINTILAVYKTNFNASAANRSANIALASKNLSGVLVPTGTTFSFNKTVGPRLAADGYKEAPVIIDGKVVPGVGGGVCQVSSTLYDAILLAGLTPVERTAHYIPAEYVPRAFDATVADGFIDFRFRNDLQDSVYIYSKVSAGTLTVFIMGSSADKAKIGTVTLKNAYNKDGSVSAYRLFNQNGTVIKKEFLHTDE